MKKWIFILGAVSLLWRRVFSENTSGLWFDLIGLAVFIIAYIISCSLLPNNLLVVAAIFTCGVVVATIFDMMMFDTINGFQRNLGPIEIVLTAVIIGNVCALLSGIWYVFRSIYRVFRK